LCRFGDDSGDDLVSLPEFDGLSGMKPGLELPGVAKLADIHLGHISSWHKMWHIVKIAKHLERRRSVSLSESDTSNSLPTCSGIAKSRPS